MGLIQIPPEILDKKERSYRVARATDIKSLARHLLLNSYAAGTATQRLTPGAAFDVAQAFADEQARRLPQFETADGSEKTDE